LPAASEYTASVEVNGLPSDHVTPLRNVRLTCLPALANVIFCASQ